MLHHVGGRIVVATRESMVVGSLIIREGKMKHPPLIMNNYDSHRVCSYLVKGQITMSHHHQLIPEGGSDGGM